MALTLTGVEGRTVGDDVKPPLRVLNPNYGAVRKRLVWELANTKLFWWNVRREARTAYRSP